MSDEDLITQAIQDANSDEDDLWGDETPETPDSYTEQDTIDDLILGKFRDYEDLENAYQELERKFHEERQSAQQYQEPVYEEQQPAFQAQFGSVPTNEDELVQWAALSPGEAAAWTIENQHMVPQELVEAVWQNWWEQAPWEASMYQMNSIVSQQQNQLAQQYEPIMEQHQNQILQSAIDNIRTQVPDFDEYAQQVADFVNTRDLSSFFPDNALDDPHALAEGLNAIVGIIKWREYQESLAQQVQYEDPEYRQQIATQTRSTAIPGDEASYDEQIQQMILNA